MIVFKANVTRHLFVLSLVIFFTFSLKSIYSQNYKPNNTATTWNRLSKYEKHKLKHIPLEMLNEMNTYQLVEACVNTRYTLFLFAYTSLEDGFARYLSEYNGLQELLRRNDAANHLLDYYKNTLTNGYNPKWESKKIGEYIHKIIVVEVLLSSEIILNQLQKSDVKILLNELLKKSNEKKSNINVHSKFGLEKNAFTIAKLIFNKGNIDDFHRTIMQNEGLYYLFLNARLKEEKDVNDLVEFAKVFLNKY